MSTPLARDLADLARRFDKPAPRYTSYPPVTGWTAPFGPADYRAALERLADRPAEGMSLYVHLPFCALRCLYCGCNAIVTRRQSRVNDYIGLLAKEAQLVTGILGRSRAVAQLHLGGGTPNFLSDEQLRTLTGALEDHFDLVWGDEASIEADPRLVTGSQLDTLRDLGFARISFGVQDTDRSVQEGIGRVQSAALVSDVVWRAREAGFQGINLDIMYGLPGQTPETFARTLDDVIALSPERIACFGYAHVPWLRPHQRALDEGALPDAVGRLVLFRMAVERLEAAGYRWIGLDHFARPTDPLAKAFDQGRLHRNFMGYTTLGLPHQVALGMSGIGDVAGAYAQNDADLGSWGEAISLGHFPIVKGHLLTEDDHLRGAAIRELMCTLRLPAHHGMGPLAEAYRRVAAHERDGLVRAAADGLHVTRLGRFLLRSLCHELDAGKDREVVTLSRAV